MTRYLKALAACLQDTEVEGGSVERALESVAEYARRASIVHLIGNGGSAAIVSHAQNDLIKMCGIKALTYQDIPLLTALSNDSDYARAYATVLSLWIKPEDLLIAVSSSGASPNILGAVDVAKQTGATIVTFSGFTPDNPLRQRGDVNFYAPSMSYGHVEITHAALLHCLTDRIAHAR